MEDEGVRGKGGSEVGRGKGGEGGMHTLFDL